MSDLGQSSRSGGSNQDGLYLEAGEAAQQLKVSASGVRRLAVIYESVYGAMPRKPKTDARLFSSAAVEQLKMARELVEAERYKSIAEALTALSEGLRPDIIVEQEALGVRDEVSGEALGVLLAEMRAMRAEFSEVKTEMARLQALPAGEQETIPEPRPEEHGVVVQAAMRLERLWRRVRGK